MVRDAEVTRLKAGIHAVDKRGTATRYPEALRDRVVRFIEARRRAGVGIAATCRQLGLAVHPSVEWPSGQARPKDVLRLDQEKHPEVLRKAAMILERENQRLAERVVDLERKLLEAQGKGGDPEQLRLRLEELQRQLQARTKALFGPKSERRGKDSKGADNKPHKGHPHRQQQLPILDAVEDLDDADKVCTQCGGQLEEWEGQEEESREIDTLCRKWFYRRSLRKKYRCRCGACIETAPAPRKLDTDSQTLWDQIERLARYTKGAYAAILAQVQSSPVVFADETPWKLFGNKSENKTWQVWVLGADDAVYYRIQDGRGADEARELLDGYAGVVMCDGYKTYSAFARSCPSIRLSHCWSHVRRRYVEIEKHFPSEVEEIIALIKELYDIEKLAPTGPPGDAMRLDLRRARSKVVIDRIQKWAIETPSLPNSGLGEAIDSSATLGAAPKSRRSSTRSSRLAA